jgi:hypothetical protein
MQCLHGWQSLTPPRALPGFLLFQSVVPRLWEPASGKTHVRGFLRVRCADLAWSKKSAGVHNFSRCDPLFVAFRTAIIRLRSFA